MRENELFEFYYKTTENNQIDKIAVTELWNIFGINPINQVKLIEQNAVLNKYFSVQNENLLFTKKGFVIYVLWIPLESIPEKNRNNFKVYQEFLIDYLYDDMIHREQIIREKIVLKSQLEKLEREVEMDERFIKITSIREQLKLADAGVKQLNTKLVSKLQMTLDL